MIYRKTAFAFLFSATTLLLGGCQTVGLVPPADVGSDMRLEGKVAAPSPSADGWKSYDYYPPAPQPDRVGPVPGRVQDLSPVIKNELPAPGAQPSGGKYAAPSNPELSNRMPLAPKDRRWGVDTSKHKTSYASLHSVSQKEAAWIAQNVSIQNKPGFDKMVVEATRYGNSEFVSISGVGYEALRMDAGKQICSKIKVTRFMANDDAPRSKIFLTRCAI